MIVVPRHIGEVALGKVELLGAARCVKMESYHPVRHGNHRARRIRPPRCAIGEVPVLYHLIERLCVPQQAAEVRAPVTATLAQRELPLRALAVRVKQGFRQPCRALRGLYRGEDATARHGVQAPRYGRGVEGQLVLLARHHRGEGRECRRSGDRQLHRRPLGIPGEHIGVSVVGDDDAAEVRVGARAACDVCHPRVGHGGVVARLRYAALQLVAVAEHGDHRLQAGVKHRAGDRLHAVRAYVRVDGRLQRIVVCHILVF